MDVKRVFACAALLAGLLFFNGRLSAAVESDIVGYTTTSLPRGFFALAVPFLSLEGSQEGYPIAQLSGNLYANDNVARADYLLVQDPDTKAYTTYYYKTQGWTKDGEDTVTTDVIAPGQGVFLYKNREAGSILAAGEVLSESSKSVTLKRGLNLVANPYPVSMAISSLAGTLYANDNPSRADTLQRLDPTTKAYTSYVLTTTGWHKVGADGTVEAEVTTDSISADECFVFNKMRSNGTLEFSSPAQ